MAFLGHNKISISSILEILREVVHGFNDFSFHSFLVIQNVKRFIVKYSEFLFENLLDKMTKVLKSFMIFVSAIKFRKNQKSKSKGFPH